MKRFLRLSVLVLVIGSGFLRETVFAQGGIPLWTRRFGATGEDRAEAIAVDTNGNIFVTGGSMAGVTSDDIITLAYSASGVPLWTNRYAAPSNSYDYGSELAIGPDGNVYVSGVSGISGTGNGYDYLTLAYSNAGVPLWTNRYNGTGNGNDTVTAMVVDTNGVVYVTGYSPINNPGSPTDYLTIAYSSTGIPLWTNRYNGPGNNTDQAFGMALAADGTVWVTGGAFGAVGQYNVATIAYSNTGVSLWTNYYDGPAGDNDIGQCITADSNGNVYVAASSKSSSASSTEDYVTLAYSATGTPLWTNRYTGMGFRDFPKAIVAALGRVFVTGTSVDASTYSDYVTLAYSGAGTLLWSNRYGTSGYEDAPRAAAVDRRGNVYVTGYSFTFGGADCLTLAYSTNGTSLWTNRYDGGASSDSATAITVDTQGNVYVTGFSYPVYTSPTPDYATIKYSALPPPPIPLQILKTENEVVLSWTDSDFKLQAAEAVSGPFTNVPGATSPYTNPGTAPQWFYRLKAP